MDSHFEKRISNGKKIYLKSTIFLVILALMASFVIATQGNPKVAPPGSKPYGKTYGQWGAEWSKYVYNLPADVNPISDPTGANCAVGQSGRVFFLVGTTGTTAERDDCVVPAGKALFFPVINILGAVPEDGATPQDVKDLVSLVTDHIDEFFVSVDGVQLQNLFNYRAPTPFFSFTGAIDNPFDTACGTPGTCYEGYHETGFTDGYWVFLAPLPPGQHSIHFGGHFYFPDWNWEFSVDVAYNLTVASMGAGK